MTLSVVEPPPAPTTGTRYTFPLDYPVTLYTSSAETLTSFTATAIQLNLTCETVTTTHQEEKGLKECHLILSVSLGQYQQILDQSLFHLKPEVRGPLHKTDFLPGLPILLELGYQPTFLAIADNVEQPLHDHPDKDSTPFITEILTLLVTQLENRTESEDHVGDRLKALLGEPFDTSNQPTAATETDLPSDHCAIPTIPPWRQTDSWLCRSVQQRQAGQTVGYATLWTYTTPEHADPVIESGTATLDAIAELLQKTTDAVKAEVGQQLPQVKQSLSYFSDELIAALEQVDWDTVLATTAKTAEVFHQPVSAIVKQFFDEDDWAYVQLDDASTLQLAFQGEAGRWTCLAQNDDDAEQVVFYSICPLTVAEDKYGAIAELLMRANDGLIIGNFELNFTTGEIRYKTSLDVEGDCLTPALMKSLVYINVQTLDTYLPAIINVLQGIQTPAEAIDAIETS